MALPIQIHMEIVRLFAFLIYLVLTLFSLPEGNIGSSSVPQLVPVSPITNNTTTPLNNVPVVEEGLYSYIYIRSFSNNY
jgi:hypothetical protein